MNGRDGQPGTTAPVAGRAGPSAAEGRLRIGVALGLAVALLVGALTFFALRDDPNGREIATQPRGATAPTSPQTTPATTTPPSSTTPTTIPATTPPTASPQPVRLTATGLGPVRFGATLAEARAALGEIVTDVSKCGRVTQLPTTDLGFWEDRFLFVTTNNPGIETEAGFRVGSAMRDIEARYPNAKREFNPNGGLALVVRENGSATWYYDGAKRGDEQPRPTVIAISLFSAEAYRYLDACT